MQANCEAKNVFAKPIFAKPRQDALMAASVAEGGAFNFVEFIFVEVTLIFLQFFHHFLSCFCSQVMTFSKANYKIRNYHLISCVDDVEGDTRVLQLLL